MTEMQEAIGTMGPDLAASTDCIGDDLFSGP